MYYRKESSRNSEGYIDMTACEAIRHIEREARRENSMKRRNREKRHGCGEEVVNTAARMKRFYC